MIRGALLVALAAVVAFGGALGVARLLREPPPEPSAHALERVALSRRSAAVRTPKPAAKVPALRPRPRPRRPKRTPTPTGKPRDPIGPVRTATPVATRGPVQPPAPTPRPPTPPGGGGDDDDEGE